jgi:hypothetical protein
MMVERRSAIFVVVVSVLAVHRYLQLLCCSRSFEHVTRYQFLLKSRVFAPPETAKLTDSKGADAESKRLPHRLVW